mgnify:CR=1 FL=1
MAHLPNKTLYFIRHGETLYNRRWRHQHAQVPLSERGRAQAAALARRFAREGGDEAIDVILASDTKRTEETAVPIAAAARCPIRYTPVLQEFHRASSVVDRSYFHPRSLYSVGMSVLKARDPRWSFEDAETPAQLMARAGRALTEILNRPEERIAVVSHRVMIMAMLDEMQASCDITIEKFLTDLLRSNLFANTAVTKVSWEDGDDITDRVTIHYHNDTRHMDR